LAVASPPGQAKLSTRVKLAPIDEFAGATAGKWASGRALNGGDNMSQAGDGVILRLATILASSSQPKSAKIKVTKK